MPEMKSVEYLRNIETMILANRQFMGFVIVRTDVIFENIDKLYANLPTDVLEIRKTDKSFEINPKTYDDIKLLEMHFYNGFLIFGVGTIVKLSEVSLLIRKIYEDLGVINLH